MKNAEDSPLASGALLASFLVLGIHDYFAEKGSHRSTFLFLGFFLLLLAGALVRRGQGETPPLARPGRAVDVLQRLLPALVCASCLVLYFFPSWHNPLRLLIFCSAGGLLVIALGFTGEGAARGAAAAAGCLFVTLIATPQFYQGIPMFPMRNLAFQITVVSSLAALALCAALKLQGRVLLLAALLSGTALRIIAMSQWELNGFIRDMLPLVESALDSVSGGRNPYRLYFLTHDVPLTYLPVMWLTYFPAWLMRIDIRWTNIFLSALGCFLMYRWGAPAPSGAPLRARLDGLLPADTSPPLLTAVMIFSFQPEIFWNSVHGEPPVYWFWVIAMLSCAAMRLHLPASILLGIVVATRHFGILLVPFYLLWLWASGFSRRDVLAHALVSGAAAAVMILPWMMLNPDTFLYGTLEWPVKYGKAYQLAWIYQIGFQSWFYASGKERWLPAIQAVSFGVIFLLTAASVFLARRRGRSEAAMNTAWIGCGLAYLVFILFGSMIWKSFLISVFLFPLVVFASRRAPREPVFLPGRGAVKVVLVVLLAAMNIAGVALAASALKGWRDRGDIVAFGREVVAPRLKPGDLLVDFSFINAWHVFQGSARSSTGAIPGVSVTTQPRSQELTRYGRVAVFDGYSMVDPEKDFPDVASGFRLEFKERKGRSSFYVYRAPSVYLEAWRLSGNFDALLEAEFEGAGPPTMWGSKYGDRFIFPGLDPWVWVGPAECLAAGMQARSILVQLVKGKTFRAVFNQPVSGEAWLLTSLDDRTLVRPQKPLEITIEADKFRRTLSVPGERGIFSWRIGKLPAGKIVMTVKRRWRSPFIFFFDWAVSK